MVSFRLRLPDRGIEPTPREMELVGSVSMDLSETLIEHSN